MPQFHVLIEDDGERIAIATNVDHSDDHSAVSSTVGAALLIAGERYVEGIDRQTLVCEVHNTETQAYRRISVCVAIGSD